MIKIKIGNGRWETDIRFPISESELYNKLAEIHAIDSSDVQQPVIVTGICWPEEFSVLEGRQVDLNEMNYLAKRLDSFDDLEMDQFLVGISKLDEPSLKNLINLTFNLDRFTLAQDMRNYGTIGRAYVLNTAGAVPANDEDDPKYVAIGKELMDRGLGEITSKGLLIYDSASPLEEVYDGHTFPPYYDRSDFVLSVTLEYNGQQELLLLPDEELAIRKAVARLGAPSIQNCRMCIDASPLLADAMMERMESLLHSESLYAVNATLNQLEHRNVNWEKLAAVAEFVDVQKLSQLTVLAERLDGFEYFPAVADEAALAHYLVDNVVKYGLDPAMKTHFDFAGFGGQFAREHDGQFVNGGFVYCNDRTMDELLEDAMSEDDGMTLGGM